MHHFMPKLSSHAALQESTSTLITQYCLPITSIHVYSHTWQTMVTKFLSSINMNTVKMLALWGTFSILSNTDKELKCLIIKVLLDLQ